MSESKKKNTKKAEAAQEELQERLKAEEKAAEEMHALAKAEGVDLATIDALQAGVAERAEKRGADDLLERLREEHAEALQAAEKAEAAAEKAVRAQDRAEAIAEGALASAEESLELLEAALQEVVAEAREEGLEEEERARRIAREGAAQLIVAEAREVVSQIKETRDRTLEARLLSVKPGPGGAKILARTPKEAEGASVLGFSVLRGRHGWSALQIRLTRPALEALELERCAETHLDHACDVGAQAVARSAVKGS